MSTYLRRLSSPYSLTAVASFSAGFIARSYMDQHLFTRMEEVKEEVDADIERLEVRVDQRIQQATQRQEEMSKYCEAVLQEVHRIER